MLFLTAAGSTQPDYVALGMVLVLALFVAVKAVRKYLSRKRAADVHISLVILQYMGVGMVVIFAIISVIIGATLLINFLFSE